MVSPPRRKHGCCELLPAGLLKRAPVWSGTSRYCPALLLYSTDYAAQASGLLDTVVPREPVAPVNPATTWY